MVEIKWMTCNSLVMVGALLRSGKRRCNNRGKHDVIIRSLNDILYMTRARLKKNYIKQFGVGDRVRRDINGTWYFSFFSSSFFFFWYQPGRHHRVISFRIHRLDFSIRLVRRIPLKTRSITRVCANTSIKRRARSSVKRNESFAILCLRFSARATRPGRFRKRILLWRDDGLYVNDDRVFDSIATMKQIDQKGFDERGPKREKKKKKPYTVGKLSIEDGPLF